MARIERCLFAGKAQSGRETIKPSGFAAALWPALGFVVLVLTFIILEFKQPYYFVQDDNFVENLPLILQGCRSLFEGAIADWNPYQFLGAPLASMGAHALTYPATYLAYAFARYVLGNELFVLDVFCIMHLIAGYFVTYLLLRRLKLRDCLAAAGGLAFILSGFVLIASRSWFTVAACAAWLPLLFLLLVAFAQSNTAARWVIAFGLATALFYHSGHAQFWMYAVLFFLCALALLVFSRKISFLKGCYVITGLILGLALIMPLFVPQWLIFTGVPRAPSGTGIDGRAVMAMLVPFPLASAQHAEPGFGTLYDKAHMTPFYYCGTVFFAASLLVTATAAILFIFKRNRWQFLKRMAADNVWLVLGIIAFLLALGSRGALWNIQSHLPFLNKFRMPFKFLLFVNLFTVLAGGVIIERCISFSRRKKFLSLFLSMAVIGLMLYNASLSTASFYSYADRPNDFELPRQMRDSIGARSNTYPARVLSLGPERSPQPNYFFSLSHNFPSIFGAYAFGGYDPIVGACSYFEKAKKNLMLYPLQAAKAYGIRWVIVKDILEHVDVLDGRNAKLAEFFLRHGVRSADVSGFVIVELEGARPFAYVKGNPHSALPVCWRSNGMDIDVSRVGATGGRIIINSLWWPGVRVSSDTGQLKTEADFWGRTIVEVAAHTDTIYFRYQAPWKEGFLAGAFFLLCAAALYFFLEKFSRRVEGRERQVSS